METGRQLRILIAIAAVFCAVIIGYNLFFVKEPSETILVTDADGQDTSGLEKIDLNTATEEELQQLEHIGETMAARIVAYREANGDFSSVEELMNVNGIGETVFKEIQDRIEVKADGKTD